MKCMNCAMFDRRKNPVGDYICYLCSGTYVSPEEIEKEICKFTGLPITEEYASKKFWLLPIDYFEQKIDEIKTSIKYVENNLQTDDKLRKIFTGMIYSQLVTAIEIYLREKFRIGMESPKAFDNFIRKHIWDRKYDISEVHGNIKQIVNMEIENINFQNFHQIGKAFKAAFEIDIFIFPNSLKHEINRILRYRHAIVHQDEIWEHDKFVKLDIPQLYSDLSITSDFIFQIQGEFEGIIGLPSSIKMDRVNLDLISDNRIIDSCETCPLGFKYNPEYIVCYEGAYDGMGFGINVSEWKPPDCGGISFKDAMYQRKILGEKGLFGTFNLIPIKDEEKKEK